MEKINQIRCENYKVYEILDQKNSKFFVFALSYEQAINIYQNSNITSIVIKEIKEIRQRGVLITSPKRDYVNIYQVAIPIEGFDSNSKIFYVYGNIKDIPECFKKFKKLNSINLIENTTVLYEKTNKRL